MEGKVKRIGEGYDYSKPGAVELIFEPQPVLKTGQKIKITWTSINPEAQEGTYEIVPATL